ncbi:MAG: SHOCT domain-containing protein [Ilumatobacter sp.]|uniref:SHOCT domain-containing protein n=1 Tax=Ilumatobacter sp. TaxID=1967498 RepID=UPI0026344C53|nr:SHOCT domain-containing protein [Ilumatobacter sp.]MDJ0770819.1 SHOCT domain-containing protein [Ilumatobacter sp.]
MFSATLGLLAREGGDGPRFLFPLVLLLLIGGLTWWLIRRRRGDRGPESALSTLQDRFARGDIDRAEFEHRHAVLTGADAVPPAPNRPAPPAPPAPPATSDAEPDTPGTTDDEE